MVMILIFYSIMYCVGFENGQHVDVIVFVGFWDSRMANMLIAPNLMYSLGLENGQHVDVFVFVFAFGSR